jgi:8-oxo-dGTP pyrophosphatase MutT (NUDIX family)
MEMQAPSQVAGVTIQGDAAVLEVSRLIWRPSVYALLFNEKGELLVLDNTRNGKYDLVGGGIDIWEKTEEALIREAWEETGLAIHVGNFVHLAEAFFQTPMNNHWHVLSMFYRATVISGAMRSSIIEDEESVNPHWIDPKSLRKGDFTMQGAWEALKKLNLIP